MTSPAPSEGKLPKGTDRMSKKKSESQPEWANGLRQLYDSVVDEPLPDTFKDLLSKLDSKD
ncbi:NepR family anti-sigma factor [Qipengyuania aquimaris]|nr:NepR family anti-sigma factor [Qipengyuania aquimaris]